MRGRPPVLTIYDTTTGEAEETINLEKFNINEVRCEPERFLLTFDLFCAIVL